MDPISMQPTVQSNSKIWIIVLIVLALIAIAFGLYFWQSSNFADLQSGANELNTISSQSSSDSVASIESDLQATNLDNLDKEASAIDAVLGATPAK